MKKVKMMKKYAELIAQVGIGASPNQGVLIRATVEMVEFVHYLATALYSAKAKYVRVEYTDPILVKQRILHSTVKRLQKIDSTEIHKLAVNSEEGGAMITLVGTDPNVFSSAIPEKLNSYQQAMKLAMHEYVKPYRVNDLAWCIAAVPTKKWASRVFPNQTPTQATALLWKAIYNACRIKDDNDPIEEWKLHSKSLQLIGDKLNKMKLVSLHYTNKLGTDLKIDLPKNYRFGGAGTTQSRHNTPFIPNLPTEEVFASPKFDSAEGIVYSTKPLSHNGVLIDQFWMRFEKGKVVEFDAKVGYDCLKSIINFDEGSAYLGECALVPFHSPISMMNILFYNTLFDENASCHLALGASFTECIENGEHLTEKEYKEAGMNVSKTHVDFMIGSEDLSIIGTDGEGHKYPLFVNGDYSETLL